MTPASDDTVDTSILLAAWTDGRAPDRYIMLSTVDSASITRGVWVLKPTSAIFLMS